MKKQDVITANQYPIHSCLICGSNVIKYSPILWDKLINEWGLLDYEVDYINFQQGLFCGRCKVNLRTMALAKAMMRVKNYDGLFKDFVNSWRMQRLQVLEVNPVGELTPFLKKLRGHRLASFPEIDLMKMPYKDNTFDLILHSDTLEHVSSPGKALSECYRVLKKGGFCIFTIPLIVDRLTRTRDGLQRSYHGSEQYEKNDLLVYSEYGADAWKQVIMAGFPECCIYSLVYPAAQALIGIKR